VSRWPLSLASALTLGLCLAAGPAGAQSADPGEDAAARRLLAEGKRLEQDGQMEAAIREYKLLLERFPKTAQAEEGLLALAEAQQRTGNPALARESAQRLVSEYPASRRAAAGLVLLGNLLAEVPSQPTDLEEARTLYRRVPLLFGRDAYPLLPARTEAQVRAGQISLRLGDFQDAAAAFVVAIEEEPRSPWTAAARLGLARVLLHQGEWVAAADELQRVAQGEAEVAPEARRWLTLIHRLKVRPAAGQSSWLSARLLPVASAQLKKPVAVAASADGRVVIADDGTDTGLVVGPEGALEGRVQAKGMGHPWWAGDRPYIPSGENIYDFTDLTNLRFLVPKGDDFKPLDKLAGGARGTFGQWYLLDRESVRAFAPAGRHLGVLAEGEPADLAQDLQGRLYVLDRKTGEVSRYSASGERLGRVVRGEWRKPEALAVDALDHLYILDRDTAQLHIFDAAGVRIAVLGPTLPGGIELRNPLDVAVDGLGRIFIADPRLGAVVVLE
jgi:outer membrane protein assembly factor BamD (BamD/ComL family)